LHRFVSHRGDGGFELDEGPPDSGSIFCCFCSGFCPAASSPADRQLRRESIAQALRFLLGPDISSQRRRFGFGSPTALQHLGLATARPASIMFLDVAPALKGRAKRRKNTDQERPPPFCLSAFLASHDK